MRNVKFLDSLKVDKTAILSAVDLLPTFCELAGVELPKNYKPDGVSQVNALMGKGSAQRDKPLFWKIGAPWPARSVKPDHWVSYAVAKDQWKLVTNAKGSHLELFDLVADPYEKNDLKEKNPKVVKALSRLLEEWKSTLPAKPTGKVFSNLRKK